MRGEDRRAGIALVGAFVIVAFLGPSLPGWRAEVIGAAEYTVKSPETNFVRLLIARLLRLVDG